jgi:SAM-dependent methyltransferase
MCLLSRYAAAKKINYFAQRIPKSAHILEVGCGSGWAGQYLRQNGWKNYVGLDLFPPADVVGDIRNWRELNLKPASFDVILAFEVVEHVDCFRECYDLLRPGGMLMATTPVPHMDWAMKFLEWVGLNQKRTSPHDHLCYLATVPHFEAREVKTIAFLAQWGIFTKQLTESPSRASLPVRALQAVES